MILLQNLRNEIEDMEEQENDLDAMDQEDCYYLKLDKCAFVFSVRLYSYAVSILRDYVRLLMTQTVYDSYGRCRCLTCL